MTKKTIKLAFAYVGLILSAYNLHRIFNLIDQNLLKRYLKLLAFFITLFKAFFDAFYGKTIKEVKIIEVENKYYFVA
jgi:hypothetical protein